MSINFQNPPNPEAYARMLKAFGEPAAKSDREFLFDRIQTIEQREMRELTNVAKQPVTVELHDVGEIKTMSDGSRYEVTAGGWRKLPV